MSGWNNFYRSIKEKGKNKSESAEKSIMMRQESMLQQAIDEMRIHIL